MCGKLESVSVEVVSPVMSTSTPGDEGETTEEPVVVVLLLSLMSTTLVVMSRVEYRVFK
jgi:hypothetical protein